MQAAHLCENGDMLYILISVVKLRPCHDKPRATWHAPRMVKAYLRPLLHSGTTSPVITYATVLHSFGMRLNLETSNGIGRCFLLLQKLEVAWDGGNNRRNKDTVEYFGRGRYHKVEAQGIGWDLKGRTFGCGSAAEGTAYGWDRILVVGSSV